MTHPLVLPARSLLPSFSNTVSTSLTRSLPPDADAVILLLGCGDPVKILYTLSNESETVSTGGRRFDISCCDIEPAVLARNILLFTLVMDADYPRMFSQIWNIFYHFFLDETSNNLLLSQCRKLMTSSIDMETWNSSEYATFIRVSSRFTLSELNRLWTLYEATGRFTIAQAKDFTEHFVAGRNSTVDSVAAAWAAVAPSTFQRSKLFTDAYHRYWKTGTTFEAQEDTDAASIVNPTFAYTAQDQGFVAHGGTFPLSPFHLTTAFAIFTPLLGAQTSQPTVFELFSAAKSQFRDWCDASRRWIGSGSPKVVMRFLVGDVLAICHTMKDYAENGRQHTFQCVSPWNAALLVLNEADYNVFASHPAPRQFNVIDTNNLVDRIGMLNILLATAPLLSPDPSSTLNTNTQVLAGKDPCAAFKDLLCCDPNSLFTMLDLIPSSCLSGFTSQPNVPFRDALSTSRGPSQYPEQISWKIPSSIDVGGAKSHYLSFDAEQLSDFLFDVYLQMFLYEDKEYMYGAGLAAVLGRSHVHYCRRSYALLIRHMVGKISTSWQEVFSLLLPRIFHDRRLLMGVNFYRELLCQLHIMGVFSGAMFSPSEPLIAENKSRGRFRHWGTMPHIVCVSFAVPRGNLRPLMGDDYPPNPLLNVQVTGSTFNNNFLSVQMSFGELSVQGQHEHARVFISEGKPYESSMVIYVWVPVWVLSREPLTTSIILSVFSTPLHAASMIRKLGVDMVLFQAALMDTNKIFVTCEAPLNPRDAGMQLCPSTVATSISVTQPPTSNLLTVELDASCQRIASIKSRIDIEDQKVKTALSNPDTKVVVTHDAPHDACLVIGDTATQRLGLPLTADLSKAKLRVARKSSWVEIIVPLRGSSSALTDFPVTRFRRMIAPWDIHRINISQLPAVDTSGSRRLLWLKPHMSLMFSDRERARKESGLQLDTLTQVKESIYTMILSYCGIEPRRSMVFGLDRAADGGIDTVIFATSLRMDFAGHTVVLDGFVLPMDTHLLEEFGQRLGDVSGSGSLMSVTVSAEELVAWKRILPAFVERCRTWSHKPDCEYARGRTIPLSTQHAALPICGCGKGIVDDAFREHKEWLPFAPHVTRLAISPLFAVSYVDPVGVVLGDFMGKASTAAPQSQMPGGIGCATCGKCPPEVTLSVCSLCKATKYCSGNCQRVDWKKHKVVCKRA